jgi:choline dehydrogenase-like flavoprotein
MRQVTDGRAVESDLELTCEVVVVGTGAGGAAAAYELARRGRAVLLLEAGDMPKRSEFLGRSSEAARKMYLGLGSTIALGNVAAAVMAGRGVGGSTTINSGTCYRAPAHTLERWVDKYGLTMLSGERLAPYYERVESMLGVAEAPREHLGGVARVVARGSDLLQLSHKPLLRNAPGCDGQGVCCFGCPTGAKRSTDVSYVPEALKRGAQLVTGAQVEKVLAPDGRARGVVARLASGRTLTVHAEAVVVAGGALLTPLLLARSGLCAGSGWLGKNLSIHPATKVMAEFDEEIDMSRGIPQSYSIDSYERDGLMFEGASTPLDVTAVAIPWVGRRFMEVMDRYPNMATFGFMIQDRSRGEVRSGPGGMPLIVYNMKSEDLARMQRGIEILTDVFLRAGARRVLPMIAGCEQIEDQAGLERLRRMRVSAGDFEVSAYHPLGTCRMGTDPARSCVGPDGEAHDVAGLFVADGSAVPSSLGVNPQMTIMAFGLRTAEALDARLDAISASNARSAWSATGSASEASASESANGPSGASSAPEASNASSASGADGADGASRVAPSALPATEPQLAFRETMSGMMRAASTPEIERPFSFAIRARSRSVRDFTRTREVVISGELMAEGFGARCPLTGTLSMDVLVKRCLRYDFTFTADDGRAYRFLGEKRMRLGALHRTMTWLPGRVLDDAGNVAATAEVNFDLERDLWGFLRSFTVARRAG